MGILARLMGDRGRSTEVEARNSLENPSVPLSLASFLGWLGAGEPTASGEVVNVQTALQVTDFYIGVRYLAQAISSLPLVIYEVKGDGSKERVDHDLTWVLATEPNDEMGAPAFWESQIGAMACAGNSYAEIIRDNGLRPRGLYPLSPGVTEPRRNKITGALEYVTRSGMDSGRERVIRKEDMLHCPLFSFDGLKGFSPITMARQTLGLARATEKFGGRFFGNGAVPLQLLTPEVGNNVTPEKAAQLKESFERNYGGENQLRTAVLTGAWKLQAMGLSPEDCQFILTQQFTRSRIAGLLGLPPHVLGDTTRLSNNNHENQTLSLVTDTFRPYCNRIEKELLRKLMRRSGPKAFRYVIEFDFTERQRGDFVTTQQGFALGRQWGWLSANDVRRGLGMNPGGKELDIYLSPLNMLDAKQVLNPPEPKPPAPAGSAIDDGQDADVDAGLDAEPDANERAVLTRYVYRYGKAFVDAFRAAGADLDKLAAELQPVVTMIADGAIHQDPFGARDDGAAARIAGDAIAAVMRRIKKRGAAWVFSEQLCRDEFRRVIRAVHIQSARQTAAIAAEEEDNDAA
jgi:HK97 family phage portal protein